MNRSEVQRALKVSVAAAREAGALMARNFSRVKKVNEASQHDIKLELDVRCQKLIERRLAAAFPDISVLGEEGDTGDVQGEQRWVIDPIDGTVNFAFGIPHACVCIALQERRVNVSRGTQRAREGTLTPDGFATLIGVIYDPFMDELWTATHDGKARLNGRGISVSGRKKLADAVVTIGFAKRTDTLNQMLPVISELVHRVMKIRIMGSAALAMTYVASGRMDAYIEPGVRLWDIAAGGLILQRAGGDFMHRAVDGEYHTYRLGANNGKLRKQLGSLGVDWLK
jgi:myo-inositol-1(or 4)-monophosphatase